MLGEISQIEKYKSKKYSKLVTKTKKEADSQIERTN